MNPQVKHFIEEHIEEIENNQWVSFWEQAVMEFPNDMVITHLVEILEDAGIETSEIRFLLLDDYIRKAIDSLYKDKIRLRLSIFQLIDRIPFDRRFGFNLRQIESHILDLKHIWNCEIWRENNNWVVRRH